MSSNDVRFCLYHLHPRDILDSSADGRHTLPQSSQAKRKQTRERSYSHLDPNTEEEESTNYVTFNELSRCPQMI